MQTRSVSALPIKVRAIAEAAADVIIDYTLFENPLPNSHATLSLIERAWSQAQGELQLYSPRVKLAETWVRIPILWISGALTTMILS